MNLLAGARDALARRSIPHGLIGAAALAVHGVPRATADLDLLALGDASLETETWQELRDAGCSVTLRRGDASDPLAGVVRVSASGEATVDVVVGRSRWQQGILARAEVRRVADADVPVVQAADLVLLKLYAGGPQDLWDVDQLLEVDPSIAEDVEARLEELPGECIALWRRVREGRRP